MPLIQYLVAGVARNTAGHRIGDLVHVVKQGDHAHQGVHHVDTLLAKLALDHVGQHPRRQLSGLVVAGLQRFNDV